MSIYLTSVFALLGAAALSGASLQSQTAPQQNTEVTVSGCVTQAEKTGSLADDTGAGIASTPATAPVDANSAQPVNAYLLTNAPRISAHPENQPGDAPTSYALVGHEDQLAKHKGHRVEIVGKLMPPRSPAGTAAGKVAASSIQRIAVDTIKMLNVECPAAKPPDVR